MKKFLLILAAVVVLLLVAVAGIVAVTFMGRQGITDGFEANGVRIVQDGITSVGVFATDDRKVALVDAGNDAAGAAILAELKRRGLAAADVSAVFVTHAHGDHVAALKLFPQAEVMALDLEVGRVAGTEAFHGPATRFMPVKPTGIRARGLRDGESVVVGQTTIRAFAVPGHTGGSAAYLVNGVLFLGDAADSDSAGALIGSPWIFSDSQAQDRASLVALSQRLAQEHADVKVLAFAHSGVRTDGLASLAAFASRQR